MERGEHPLYSLAGEFIAKVYVRRLRCTLMLSKLFAIVVFCKRERFVGESFTRTYYVRLQTASTHVVLVLCTFWQILVDLVNC